MKGVFAYILWIKHCIIFIYLVKELTKSVKYSFGFGFKKNDNILGPEFSGIDGRIYTLRGPHFFADVSFGPPPFPSARFGSLSRYD
jgi:hypothetical protein